MGYGYTVKIEVDRADNLTERMHEVRDWLDRQRFNSAISRYRIVVDGELLAVDFSVFNEA